jgi:hypothetical protein
MAPASNKRKRNGNDKIIAIIENSSAVASVVCKRHITIQNTSTVASICDKRYVKIHNEPPVRVVPAVFDQKQCLVDWSSVHNTGPRHHKSAVRFGGVAKQISVLLACSGINPGEALLSTTDLEESSMFQFTDAEVKYLLSPGNTIDGRVVPAMSRKEVEILQHGMSIAVGTLMITKEEINAAGFRKLKWIPRNRSIQEFLITSAVYKASLSDWNARPVGEKGVCTYLNLPKTSHQYLKASFMADFLEQNYRNAFGSKTINWELTKMNIMKVKYTDMLIKLQDAVKKGLWSFGGATSQLHTSGMEYRHYRAANYFQPLHEFVHPLVHLTMDEKKHCLCNGDRIYITQSERDLTALCNDDCFLF